MADVPLRTARGADAAALAELWLSTRRAAATRIPATVRSEDEVLAWFREVAVPAHETWVAEDAGEILALMVLAGDWVEQLYVAPGHQRRGLGSRLLDTAKSQRDALALWTFESNRPAIAFYAKHGFAPDGSPSTDNEEGAPALCLRWRR